MVAKMVLMNKVMTTKQIQAVGIHLSTYSTDLNYIRMFQAFKSGKISETDYVRNEIGTFYTFLVEFRVARNFAQGTVGRLLNETINWVNGGNVDDVDQFAEKLASTDLTRGNIMTSLASKILFLNNPWEIIPMDKLARKALQQKDNRYSTYRENIFAYRQANKPIIENVIQFTAPLTSIIESEYSKNIEKIDFIRENRIIDKLLWASGK